MKKILSAFIAVFAIFCGCSMGMAESVSDSASSDGYTAADLTALQNFLLGEEIAESGRNFDLNNDGRWDVFDMCLMRGKIKENQGADVAEYSFCITANGTTFMAEFADNPSAAAFRELLKNGDITVKMHDYGNFEKVGDIGTELPRTDERITTEAGDVILYQGKSITVYYDENTWNFTRLGKIGNVTREQLLGVFGAGDVDMTFSLNQEANNE